MTEPTLAIQELVCQRLRDAHVIPDNNLIVDGPVRTSSMPCVVVGQSHVNFPNYLDEFSINVFTNIDIWSEDLNTVEVKTIAGKVREALFKGPWSVEGFTCANLRIEGARFMRDPGGKLTRGILTVNTILQESVVLR